MCAETLRPRLSLGFIGGSIKSAVGYAHFVSSTLDDRWSVVAGSFSTDSALNMETARTYGVSADRVYASWSELLSQEKDRLDAVVVLTPTPSHTEIVIACLQAGVAVICEKALAASCAEAKSVLAARNASKGFLAVTFNYSGYPMVRELRKRIQAGALGKVLHFQAEMPQEGFVRTDMHGNKPTPQAWRLVDGNIPTIHLDLAVHLHQLIYYLIGQKPIEVASSHGSYGWFDNIIDNVICLSRYSDDIQGQFWFSKAALGHRNGLRLRIYGSSASAEWYQANPEELIVSSSDGRREIVDRASGVETASLPRYNRFKAGHPAGFVEAFANLYCDIADCFQQYSSGGSWRSEDVFSADLALEGLQFLEALSTSARRKTWEAVFRETDL